MQLQRGDRRARRAGRNPTSVPDWKLDAARSRRPRPFL